MLRTTINTTRRNILGSVRTYAIDQGSGAPDAMNKREKAQEDMYMRNREAEKLKKLRESLSKQKEHIADIEKQLDELHKKE
ncbi:hypothetical protein SAICODRAFT_18936 [Saitoella complicata NRRL Y-17804]|uniref:uncharacterized protein n=1 Tax=Saitoella complicata (strain BCRC 22490 / CBS 7301 / JCM 7358 / NBRC 10748 / NRRL Y-17804) TaxID=698492 RepID=UPI000866A71B|nr:uncharacterized protein SAICODRAFT_18936 [Saitoella complicata NRRL Y-17804]ODQ53449.1 hypothetical protein SAICODRAFT_18936 [Saitoella complicata NRRL Y-17804]